MINYVHVLTIPTILIRVALALVIGGIIGMERGRKNQPAGFRTYMLVCLGASLVMMTNQYIVNEFSGGDPSRLGAQVISGIGSLGAGTIIVTRKSQVRGLTTAAGLWSAGCVGLAIGIGFYEGAIAAGVAILLIMTIFHKIDMMLLSNSSNMRLYLNFSTFDAVKIFVDYCRENEYKVIDLQMSKGKEFDQEMVAVMVSLRLKKKMSHIDIINNISEIKGLKYIEEI